MDLASFVRVMGALKGTGYLLRPGVVLTAGHVVAGEKTVRVEFDDAEGEVVKRPAEVVWQAEEGNGGLDAAVLRFEAEGGSAELPGLARGPLLQDVDFRSRGWAKAALPERSVADSLVPFGGTAHAFVLHTDRFYLTVEGEPAEVDDWKGISGAPVFAGGQIQGVIVDGLPRFEGRKLRTVPMHRLLARADFAAAIGLES